MYNLTDFDYEKMNEIAAQSIIHGLTHNAPKLINPSHFSENLKQPGKTYVSLTLNEENIGCIGNLDPMPLFLSSNRNAFKSAFKDNRFYRMNKFRSLECDCKIHYLKGHKNYYGIDKNVLISLIEDDDSVYLSNGYKSSIFLSMMQKKFTDKLTFINELLKKADLDKNYNFSNLKIFIYKTVEGKSFKIKDYMEK